jgi:tetratricopeptide (TPR) repeat protein
MIKEDLMRLPAAAVFAFAALVAAAPAVRAQETDEQMKKRILDKVRERLQEEKKSILERMSKVIDEELSGGPKRDGPAAPAPPAAQDKRIRDLQRKLQALDDQRDDIMRDIRGFRRETEDAKIIQDAKRSPPETMQEAQAEFKEAFDLHNEATSDLSSDKGKALKGFEKSIAGFKRLYYALKDVPEANGLTLPSAYNVACGYALSGKSDEAIDWLEMAIKAGYDDWDHIRQDSDFASIRKERRLLRLLADR